MTHPKKWAVESQSTGSHNRKYSENFKIGGDVYDHIFNKSFDAGLNYIPTEQIVEKMLRYAMKHMTDPDYDRPWLDFQ